MLDDSQFWFGLIALVMSVMGTGIGLAWKLSDAIASLRGEMVSLRTEVTMMGKQILSVDERLSDAILEIKTEKREEHDRIWHAIERQSQTATMRWQRHDKQHQQQEEEEEE